MADTQPYQAKKRGFETLGDMARSLIPIAVLILAFVLFVSPHGGSKVNRIDPSDDISSLAEYGGFAVIAPQGLPKAWAPTSSNLLHESDAVGALPLGITIGYVTPKQKFASYTLRTGARSTVVAAAISGSTLTKDPAGSAVTIDGRQWTPITLSNGQGYVCAVDTNLYAVVEGGASDAELQTLAGSLRPIKPRP